MIVGGGVDTPKNARDKVLAGADIIVQGTFIEENIMRDNGASLEKIIQAIKEAGKKKIGSETELKTTSVAEGKSIQAQD